ncbi:MAG: DUF58 domain-containing protein [Microscillaceae bacterium]|nr:DUF58 domain-containing protein [Microscillaceae bacterium]MDW8459716.1 DUF58 domain-containing protein [Cytophagales bacterium]
MIKKILSKIRNYEIRMRKAVNAHLRGSFHSVFKGAGLEFEDVRMYQYGDDVRRIDWNVSAKGEGTFVKVFKEEKEQTVFFLLDVSRSQELGKETQTKIDIGKEICGVLALAAAKEQSQVGLICFSDQKEKYIKPDKGVKKAYEIILNLLKLKPKSSQTNLTTFIQYALNLIKRRSIVILISDFIDQNYHDALRAMARKHDLIVIHLIDATEMQMPKMGIVPLFDKESQKVIWVNSSSEAFQQALKQRIEANCKELETFCRKNKVNYLAIYTHEDFVPKLVRLFKIRNREA